MGKLMKGWGVVGRWMERRRMRVPRMMVRMVTRDKVWWRGKVPWGVPNGRRQVGGHGQKIGRQ